MPPARRNAEEAQEETPTSAPADLEGLLEQARKALEIDPATNPGLAARKNMLRDQIANYKVQRFNHTTVLNRLLSIPPDSAGLAEQLTEHLESIAAIEHAIAATQAQLDQQTE